MASQKLSMRKTREILRQKWALQRSHREVAASQIGSARRTRNGGIGAAVV